LPEDLLRAWGGDTRTRTVAIEVYPKLSPRAGRRVGPMASGRDGSARRSARPVGPGGPAGAASGPQGRRPHRAGRGATGRHWRLRRPGPQAGWPRTAAGGPGRPAGWMPGGTGAGMPPAGGGGGRAWGKRPWTVFPQSAIDGEGRSTGSGTQGISPSSPSAFIKLPSPCW
jgi:hypothetical protein